MKRFTVYDTDGRIVKSGVCQDQLFESQAINNCFLIEKESKIGLQYVANGEIKDIPSKPGSQYKFDYKKKSWVIDDEISIAEILSKRQYLLESSDWTDLLSSYDRLGEVKYSEWQTYRQALRDITSQPGYPTDVKWPTAPA